MSRKRTPAPHLRLVADNSSVPVSGTPRSSANAKSGKCHFPGTPVMGHFRKLSAVTPSSRAKGRSRSKSGCSSDEAGGRDAVNAVCISDYSEFSSAMSSREGRGILFPEQNSADMRESAAMKSKKAATLTPQEIDEETERAYNEAFFERVRQAHSAHGLSDRDAAENLNIPKERYRSYHRSTMMPHYLIKRFARMSLCDPEWIMWGEGQEPINVRLEARKRAQD